MQYRPEIDGLRALAVLSVMIYHAGFDNSFFELKGGFLGVDVFFVISGYLISGLILGEIHKTGAFNFYNFYERRARRILPMLFAVITVSLPFAWARLLPPDLVEYAESVVSSIFFASNFFFYFVTTAYGADSSLLKPLLHTWSLGVEEQFYILFPIILIITYRMYPRSMPITLMILILISLTACLLTLGYNKEFNFYSPLSRFWELIAGATLAALQASSLGRRFFETEHHELYSFLGLVLIVTSFYYFNESHPHPSYLTIIPVFGTLLVIAFSEKRGFARQFLSNKIFVAIGLISYSAYLWHFPIMAFARLQYDDSTDISKSIWVILTLVLATISYFIIERPFRNSEQINLKKFVWLTSVASLCLVSGSVVAISLDGFKARVPGFLQTNLPVEGYRSLAVDGLKCHQNPNFKCEIAIDKGTKTSVFLVGDSVADALSNNLYYNLKNKGVSSFVQMTNGGCPLILGHTWEGGCTEDLQKRRLSFLLSQNPGVVVFVANFHQYVNKEDFRNDSLITTLTQISSHHDVILVYPIPEVPIHLPKFLYAKLRTDLRSERSRNFLRDAPYFISQQQFFGQAKRTVDIFDGLKNSNIHRVYPHTIFCAPSDASNAVCKTHSDNELYYADQKHPSPLGADMISSRIIKVIEKITAQ